MGTATSPPARGEPTWRDRKKPWWLLGVVMPLLPLLSWALVTATGSTLGWFFAPFFVFVVVPLVDLVVGLDPSTPPEEVIAALEEDRYYRWVTFAFLPVQYAVLVWSAWMLGHGGLSTLDKVGLAVGVGIVGGVAINTAHELGHKVVRHERWLARIALAQPAYGHFYIEHNRGHHVRVATPDDPASARFGESVWRFLPRTVVGGLRGAWGLESRRIRRRGGQVWSPANDVLTAWAMSLLLWTVLVVVGGWAVLPWLLVQAVVGVWLLESVNYLEHYGLVRARLPSGRFEHVDARHSWNSNNIGTNVLLYHLQRHSDHHANPTRRYQSLRDDPAAPTLPTGYAGMIVLSWVPALWRRVMDPRVLAHVGGDLSRVHHPPGGTATASAPAADRENDDATPSARMACPACGWVYDERAGAPREGWPAGTAVGEIDADWPCPDCGVRERRDFVPAPLPPGPR